MLSVRSPGPSSTARAASAVDWAELGPDPTVQMPKGLGGNSSALEGFLRARLKTGLFGPGPALGHQGVPLGPSFRPMARAWPAGGVLWPNHGPQGKRAALGHDRPMGLGGLGPASRVDRRSRHAASGAVLAMGFSQGGLTSSARLGCGGRSFAGGPALAPLFTLGLFLIDADQGNRPPDHRPKGPTNHGGRTFASVLGNWARRKEQGDVGQAFFLPGVVRCGYFQRD